jgi:hypothetical protein
MSAWEFFHTELHAQPDETEVFVLTGCGILEWNRVDLGRAVKSFLTEKPKSHLYYCSPISDGWDHAEFQHLRLWRERTESQISDWVTELRKDFADRVDHWLLPMSHFFHPSVKTVLFRLPEPSWPGQAGAVELKTNECSISFFRLNNEAVGDAFNWLEMCRKS